MTKKEIKNFIMFYEKHEHMIKSSPKNLNRNYNDDNHRLKSIKFN